MKKQQKPYTTSIAVDVAVFTFTEHKLKILLIKRAYGPYTGFWALPGGFMEKNETTLKAAMRVLKEKAGLKNFYLEQLYTFDASGRDPRGNIPTVAYFALVADKKIKFGPGVNLQAPKFFEARKLPALAFDHGNIIKYALKRLAAKLEYTSAASALLPRNFRLFDLQRIYEETWGKKLNKRNFQKKYFSLKLIHSTGKVLSGGHHRPARLYTFASKKPAELKRFF